MVDTDAPQDHQAAPESVKPEPRPKRAHVVKPKAEPKVKAEKAQANQKQTQNVSRGVFARISGSMARAGHVLHKYDGWVTAVATVFLAALTLVLAVYAGHQETIIKVQQADSRAIQRAFLGLNDFQREVFRDQSGKVESIKITPIIKNTGVTPAREVTLAAFTPGDDVRSIGIFGDLPGYFYKSWKIGAPEDPDHILEIGPDSAGISVTANTYVGPGGTIIPYLSGVFLNSQTMNRMLTNQTGRFLFGTVHYKDVFNASHVTKYCVRLDNITTTSEGLVTYPFPCTHWNCMDEDCKADKAAYEDEYAKAPANNQEDFRKRTEDDAKKSPTVLPPFPNFRKPTQ